MSLKLFTALAIRIRVARKKKERESKKSGLSSIERTRNILILAVWGNKVAPWSLIISNSDTADALIIRNSIFDGFLPAQVKEEYVLLDWGSLKIIPERARISEISEHGIVFRLQKAPLADLRGRALSIRQWAMTTQGATQDHIFRHLENKAKMRLNVPTGFGKPFGKPFRMPPLSKSCPRGSSENPFESAQALLSFLQDSEPEKYVFRGQAREYGWPELPLLPSGYRKWFRPFPPGHRTSKFVGMTYTVSEKQQAANKLLKEVVSRPGKYEKVIMDARAAWDLLGEDFHISMSDFLPKPEVREVDEILAYNQANTMVVLSGIVSPALGLILGQQYGLISTLLDATTNPNVAMFFANYQYPYYHPVGASEELGVIYRWPREVGILAEDFFKPLEAEDFESLSTSLRRLIEGSKSLNVGYDITWEWGFRGQPVLPKPLPIIVTGEERDLKALVFPKGAFAGSRMARQGAAFLMPDTEHTDYLSLVLPNEELPKDSPSQCTLIADIMKTYGGETFYFRHSGELPDLRSIDKFYLWPIQEHPKLSIEGIDMKRISVMLEQFHFQDKYMEFLVRFFSPSSPVMLFLLLWLGGGKRRPGEAGINIGGEEFALRTPGGIRISPGFAIHPDEAETIAMRLLKEQGLCDERRVTQRMKEQGLSPERPGARDRFGNLLSGPISFPIEILIPGEDRDKFHKKFTLAASRFLAK